MKTMYSFEHFKKYREVYENNHTIKPEKELEYEMSFFDKNDYNEKSYIMIQKFHAKKVYDRNKKELLKQKPLYLQVLNNKVNLGYTTEVQERKAQKDIIQDFEFNCFVLKEFKDKHKIEG